MVDVKTPPAKAPEKSTRTAALWAAAVAVPIAVLVGFLIFLHISPQPTPAAKPTSTALQKVPATPVQLSAPQLPAADAQACQAVTAQLPASVRNLPARKVSAGPEQNAAYGDPAITLECGVAQPKMCETITPGQTGCVPLDADLLVMNGVCWYGEDGPATKLFTTMDRATPVRVSVPASYDQPAQWANEFSDAVAAKIKPTTAKAPTGCRN
jgi:Protein of unknown function (DUF3515)